MKRYIDKLGRMTLPKGFRDELNIPTGDEVDVDINDNQLIITVPSLTKTKKEIKRQLEIIEDLEYKEDVNQEHLQGYKDALKWCLNEDSASNNK